MGGVRGVRAHFLLGLIGVLLTAGAPHALAQPAAGTPPAPLRDPGETKLTWIPTARTLPRGDVSLTMVDFFPILQVGLTDRVSIGAGTFGLPVDTGRPLVLVTPKVQLYRGTGTQVAAGTLHLVGVREASIGLAYGVATHGTNDAAVTAGVACLYARSKENGGAAAAGLVGFEHRIGSRTKAVGDALIAPGAVFATTAIRMVRTHAALDLGAVFIVVDGEVAAFPVFGLVWRF
jgi:hypothetical protein